MLPAPIIDGSHALGGLSSRINVGGANQCQPAQIAKELAKFGVVNIGAVGTFVVREDVSESTLRAALLESCRSNARS